VIAGWRQRVRQLRRETYALYLAYRDPRVPWVAKLLAACVVAYAFSPIDLIPDFIPVLGTLDDFVLIPLGIALSVKLIPPQVMAECRARAAEMEGKPTNWAAAAVIVALWIGLAALSVALVARVVQK
jgi:uncharacterized membrane protein YkvA (DUF1232 family)